MRIIPAIDILEGKCVRLTKGDFSTRKVYNEDPLEAAKAIEDSGLKFLHLVDLDGARNKKVINYRILERIASETKLIIDFGGGIRSFEDLHIAFSSGASQVTGGTIAVNSPDLFLEWLAKYGSDKIILGADCIGRKIATEGWTGESDADILGFLKEYTEKGIVYSVCTDVERDGMMKGPATELYKEILGSVKVRLIASGGISSLNDIDDVREAGCEGAIIGKALYEGKIKLKELKNIC